MVVRSLQQPWAREHYNLENRSKKCFLHYLLCSKEKEVILNLI